MGDSASFEQRLTIESTNYNTCLIRLARVRCHFVPFSLRAMISATPWIDHNCSLSRLLRSVVVVKRGGRRIWRTTDPAVGAPGFDRKSDGPVEAGHLRPGPCHVDRIRSPPCLLSTHEPRKRPRAPVQMGQRRTPQSAHVNRADRAAHVASSSPLVLAWSPPYFLIEPKGCAPSSPKLGRRRRPRAAGSIDFPPIPTCARSFEPLRIDARTHKI